VDPSPRFVLPGHLRHLRNLRLVLSDLGDLGVLGGFYPGFRGSARFDKRLPFSDNRPERWK
jgi:hypothetical protein